MKNKIFDYVKSDFWKMKDFQGKTHYFFNVKKQYIEVSKDVHKVCESSYDKLRYNVRRKAEKSVISYNDENSSAFFQNNCYDSIEQIYINDMARLVVNEIYKLNSKWVCQEKCVNFLKFILVVD